MRDKSEFKKRQIVGARLASENVVFHQHHIETRPLGKGMAQNPSGHNDGLVSVIPKTNLSCIGSKRSYSTPY